MQLIILRERERDPRYSSCPTKTEGAHVMFLLPSIIPFVPKTRDAVPHEHNVFFYVSRIANFRSSDPRYGAVLQDQSLKAHMKCAFSLASFPSFPRPRTQCHTSATSLRKQPSKLQFKRPQIRGGVQGCTLPPVSQGRLIWREPRTPEKGA